MINKNKEQQQTLQIYAAFGTALILSLVPHIWAAGVSTVLGLGTLCAAYALRAGNEDGSLIENHMTFIIRTFWIGSLLILVTLGIGGFYMLSYIDHAPMMACAEKLLNATAETTNVANLSAQLEPCMETYIATNKITFIISGLIIAGPVLAYFLMRYAKGFLRAKDGYRISDPLSWL